MVWVQPKVRLTTPILSDPLLNALRGAHRPDSHLLGTNEVRLSVCACMPSFVGIAARPRLLCKYFWVTCRECMQNVHVSAHSITDSEVLGDFSTVKDEK